VWNAHNTLFGWKWSAICALAVYFLHSTMPSDTCLRLSDVCAINRVTYFQFPIQSAFLPCRSARQHRGVLGFTQYWTLDVAENLGQFLVWSAESKGMIFNSNSKNGNKTSRREIMW